MTWIRLDTDFPDHELIGTLAEALRIDPDRAAMTLVRVWLKLADFQPDGYLDGITDTTLEDWAKWRGKRGVLAAQLRAMCLDHDGKIKGWWRQEKLLKHQIEKRGRPKTGAEKSPESRPSMADDSNSNSNGTTAISPGAVFGRLVEKVAGHPKRFTVTEFFEQIPADRNVEAWAGVMIGCLEMGTLAGGAVATVDELAAACLEYPGIRNCGWSPGQFIATVERTVKRLRRKDIPTGPAQSLSVIERARAEFLGAAS